MKKFYLLIFSFLFVLLMFVIMNGCKKDTTPQCQTFTEEFDTVANLYRKGWILINNSRPLGSATWQQGIFDNNGKLGPEGFPAYSYHSSGDEYILVNTLAGSDVATISCWLITPPIEMKDGDKFSFYTRTDTAGGYPDRLQVRINTTDDAYDVGNTATSVGNFTTVLLDINPQYSLGANGYPIDWKQYTLTLSGLNKSGKHRIAFRYFVENGGPGGANSNAIGIDLFRFESL